MEGTVLIAPPQEVVDFLTLPKGPRKNVLYQRLPHKEFAVCGGVKKEGSISFYYHWMKVYNVQGACYIKATRKSGLTFKDNKLSVWFGKDLKRDTSTEFYNKLFEFMGWNFLKGDIPITSVFDYMTKGILEKLFKGKITSVRSLLAEYAKANRMKVSTELFYKAVKTKHLSRMDFLRLGKVAKDPNHFLEWRIEDGNLYDEVELLDLVNQFKILEKKIDFKWSSRRIKEEHDKAVKELMEYEVGDLSDEEIEYPKLDYPKEFTLINSEKKIFVEAKMMNHCLYTNYASSIKSKTYLAFHVSLGGEEATLGVFVGSDNVLTFNQVYKKHNQYASEEMRKFCKDWIQRVNGSKKTIEKTEELF